MKNFEKIAKPLVTSGAVCALLSALTIVSVPTRAVAAEVEGPKVTWLVSLWGARRGLTEGIEGLAEYVSEKTDGNFKLSLQYGGVLSDPKENIDGIQLGAFEAALFCPVYHPQKTPALTGLDLAFLPLPSLEVQRDVYEAYFTHPVVQEEFARWNAVPLMTALLSNYEVMGKGTPPEAIEDWKGLRMNASGGMASLMEAMGANPTTIPAPDAFTSLERGIVDGVVFPYTYAFASYRLHEVSDWVTDGWGLGTIQCSLAANSGAYSALPQQYKDLLDEAKAYGYEHQIETYKQIDDINEVAFAEENLIRIPMSEGISAAVDEAVAPSWEAWVNTSTEAGLPGQELLDLILSTAKSATEEQSKQ
jgi:TRAP-type mannitol/chloroaromatic compound transport system substrate-binding protein